MRYTFQNWIDPSKPLLKHVAKDDRQNRKLQLRVKVMNAYMHECDAMQCNAQLFAASQNVAN